MYNSSNKHFFKARTQSLCYSNDIDIRKSLGYGFAMVLLWESAQATYTQETSSGSY